MHKTELIAKFYAAILLDDRISFRHIAIYLALVQQNKDQELGLAVSITRKKVMQYSKIRSISTYHKCMSELQQFGYIDYKPSYSPLLGSFVCFVRLK